MRRASGSVYGMLLLPAGGHISCTAMPLGTKNNSFPCKSLPGLTTRPWKTTAAIDEKGREGQEEVLLGARAHKQFGYHRTWTREADDSQGCHLMARSQKIEMRERWYKNWRGGVKREGIYFRSAGLGLSPDCAYFQPKIQSVGFTSGNGKRCLDLANSPANSVDSQSVLII